MKEKNNVINKKENRDSNYELLRIISTFFIILWHIITHGKLIEFTSSSINLVMNGILLFVIVHVNLFMLITGYYQSTSAFKLKKICHILLEIVFYNFLINTVLCLTGLMKYNNIEYLKSISFFNIKDYWYLQCYLIVYVLSPFLNKLINSINKTNHKKLILISFCCFSLFPYLTGGLFYDTDGLTIMQFIMLYFIGAYIKKYNINKEFFLKANITQKRIIYIILFILTWFINLIIFYFANYLEGLNSNILNYVSSSLLRFKYNYSNPFVIAQSLYLFLLFGTFKFKNKIINKIAALVLGIYIIHEASGFKVNLYKWLTINNERMIYSKSIILKLFCVAVIIFISCAIIEFLRQLIFKLFHKSKKIKKMEINILDFFHRLFYVGK